MSDEDWYNVIAVSLPGAFFNISSIVGETGNIGQANYGASKSGLFRLTKSLARARRSSSSGPIGCGRTRSASPLGRPDEIARVVHLLASDHSSFIAGAVWDVNGGQEM